MKRDIRPVTIPDPFPDAEGKHQPVTVMCNIDVDPVERWYRTGIIDQGEYQAATRFMGIFLRAEGSQPAIDYARDKVDVIGHKHSGIPDSVVDAVSQINTIEKKSGIDDYGMSLLRAIVGLRHTVQDTAWAWGIGRNRVGRDCRSAITLLAIHFGYKERKRNT